ncbi:MAG TPA: MopE-related protein, partial [Candidatus Saccharimonadales bacterium]|nr:MopE-related protein [Candidatus Saccharimonadales bacterium]
GTTANLPVRLADFEVVDAGQTGRKAILASGAIDRSGHFTVVVPDSKIRDVYVRVITRSDETPGLNIDVRTSSAQNAPNYAAASVTVPGHNPGVNLDFGASIIQIGEGGEPFNTYDQMVSGADYAAFLTGAWPSTGLATVWAESNGISGSYYDSAATQIILRDTAGYDDTVVLHEMGHFIIREYSSVFSPGGTHTFAFCNIDVRLAFDEGWATFWGNSVLRHEGRPRANIYTRTNGAPGPGNLVRSADLENDTQYLCKGDTSEVTVFTVLWDIVDGPSTTDETPGVDDDGHDHLDLPDSDLWRVFTDYLPGASSITLEDFWDGWFLPPSEGGYQPEMAAIAEYVGVEFVQDAWEDNGSPATATPFTVGTPAIHATFFRDPDGDGAGEADEDYYSFAASAGQTYVIETMNLLNGADTKIYLYDTDGTTALAINDNRASGDLSSRLEWTAPASGTYFVKAYQAPGYTVYGSYDFRISPLNPVDLDNDGYIASLDCDDDNPAINPSAPELCNGIDDNCNSLVDEGFDQDFDGYTVCGGDCNDSNPGVNPSATEVPGNGLDDNCNGLIDEGISGGRRRSSEVPYKPGSGDS